MRYEVEYDLHQRGGALRRTVEAESAEEAVAEVRRVQPGIPELPFRLVRVTEIEDKAGNSKGVVMKLCVDCKHFNRGSTNCEHPKNQKVSLVSGLKVPVFLPGFLRDNQPLHVCGPDGNWFEERKEQVDV